MGNEILELNRFEQSSMYLYRRYGALGLICMVTTCSVVMSLALALPLIKLIPSSADFNDPATFIPVIVLVPLVVAPICCLIFTQLLYRLDQAFAKVTQLSTTDPLTGSANRRGFMQAAEQNIRTLREADKCVVGMVDLDDFKLVNDTHGHQVGDEALTDIATKLKEQIKDTGIVGRLGGDEFAFVLLGSCDALDELSQRIQRHCTAFKMESGVDVSCSIGMVNVEGSESLESALQRADQALYEIKHKR
ncbi:MAG: GGDEF domain-containing protein [Granulosicoccus sp.]